jgi:hypothetical protein
MRGASEGKRALAMLATCAGLLVAFGGFAPGAPAQTAASAGTCGGTSLTPSTRSVRRGGQVLVSGQACEGNVRISLRKGRRWVTVGNASTVSWGGFAACVPVRAAATARVVRIRASGAGGTSRPVSVRLTHKGSGHCVVPDYFKSTNAHSKRGGGGGTTSPTSYTLTVSPSGNGSVSGPGIACPGDCSQSYTTGTVVALVATPASGSTFTGWGGACSGTGTCSVTMSAAALVTATFATSPLPPPPTTDPCPLGQAGSTIGMTLPSSCTVVASDTASNPNPIPFWGSIDCQDPTRHQQYTSGGDSHPTGLGSSQGDGAYRRLTVMDGDNFWGERCELGHNWTQPPGPTVFYYEGMRRVTFISLRLGNNVNPADTAWRAVMQMKQTQPYYNPNTSPIFELEVRSGKWAVESSWHDLWYAPAQANTWTRFAFDVTYSQDPAIGSIKVYIDLNGDGDAGDTNEQSPVIHTATLRAEVAGGTSPYLPGQSIPDHLRAGIYENAAYNCPGGCSVDVDNVQVVKG